MTYAYSMCMNTTQTKDLLTAEIVVVSGCTCADSVRWFNCYCAAIETTYDALPLNWRDVHTDGDRPDDTPTVEAVADVIRANPGCKFRYFGGNSRILGANFDGKHIDLARELAKKGS